MPIEEATKGQHDLIRRTACIGLHPPRNDQRISIDRSLADATYLTDAIYEVMLNVWSAYDDTVPMLRALRDAGLRLALISNAGVPIRTVLDRDGITDLVDAIVLSYEVGWVKPDLRIFQAAVNTLGLRPTQVLMVGDSGTDDVGGTPLGIRTLILPRTTGRIHGLDLVTRMLIQQPAP